jgi:predicted lipoprotein with Yx(FWY)xxD motif
MRRILALAVAVAVGVGVVLLVTTQAHSAARSKGTTVTTGSTKLGTILVDGQHHTLYLFEKDRRGRSACRGACAAAWPPLLTTGRPKAAGGAKASRLGTTRRPGGVLQVTYGGHPLYRYIGDGNRVGAISGQDSHAFGADWYVVGTNGKANKKDA